MKRLVFIVEGDTEIALIEKLIIPYLVGKGYSNHMHAQTIITNRKQHKKGGVGRNYGLFRNEVKNTLAQGNVIVTTLIDFFRLPGDFPSYTNNSQNIQVIESAIWANFNNHPDFIPYIQRHELEALMFSSMEGFRLVVDQEEKLTKIQAIIDKFNNPEDINNLPETAPSKRLEQIYNYDKKADGEMIFEMIGIDSILAKCPRFREWITKIEVSLK
jgi:hypothetical protein